ncbi:MAG: c-type cytochrome, partial [Alphaproteobacteria bacterium]|nr:c-type cytochrome [Alphaproteobacteria bacterium]
MKKTLLAVLFSACCTTTGHAELLFRPEDPEIVEFGKNIYDGHCATCHGANLEGQPNWQRRKANGRLPAPPQNEHGHTWHHTEKQLINITKYGPQSFSGADYQSDMPAFENILTDDEIIAVLSYIKSTWSLETSNLHSS